MTKFRHPGEIEDGPKKVPVSTRVSVELREVLENYASANGRSLAEIMAMALEDYAKWLRTQPKRWKKKS